MKNVLGVGYCVALLVPTLLMAQEPLATDRPDFVESSATVGKGVFQFETSAATDWVDVAGITARIVGTPTLFRLGVSPNLELRLETEGYQRATFGSAPATTGLADASIGLKWHAVDGMHSRPAVAFLLHGDVASGSEEFRGEGFRPSLRMVAEWELPNEFGMGMMPGVGYSPEGDGSWSGQFGLVVGHPITENIRAFVEYAAEAIPLTDGGEKVALFEFGTAWILTPDMQVDLSAGFGLTDESPDGMIAIGFSRRFR